MFWHDVGLVIGGMGIGWGLTMLVGCWIRGSW